MVDYISSNINRFEFFSHGSVRVLDRHHLFFLFPSLIPTDSRPIGSTTEKKRRRKEDAKIVRVVVPRTRVFEEKKKKEARGEGGDDKEERGWLEGGGRGERVLRVVVHLSLISRGRSRLAGFLLQRIEGRIELRR